MELLVNGERRYVSDDTTAAALLEQLAIQPERVVVEVNLTILRRDQLASTILHPGDQVEIVHFVGGGSFVIAKPVT
jgi:thiamine biosynthesis protein ThiS